MKDWRKCLVLPLILLGTGMMATFIHDAAYRRGGGDDFELGGYISHAGTDMFITTVVLGLVAFAWEMSHESPK